MIDHEINLSFDLDFEIYSSLNGKFRTFTKQFETPRLKSDEILKEFENYVNSSREALEEIMRLLNECNVQRMNFRMMLIKILKEKLQIDKLLKEEGDVLILKKLLVHDELKNKIIDKRLDQLAQSQKMIGYLKEQCSIGLGNANGGTAVLTSVNKSPIINNRSSFNCSSILSLNQTQCQSQSNTTQRIINSKNNMSLNTNTYSHNNLGTPLYNHSNLPNEKGVNSPMNISFNNTINDSNNDSVLKKMLNLDFNTEKYNIISNSPIQTPSSKKIIYDEPNMMQKNKSVSQNTSSFKQRNFYSNSMVNTPHKKSQANGFGFNSSMVINTDNNAGCLDNNKVESYACNNSKLRKKTQNQIKMKKFSKSIDFDSSYDYFHYQTQENIQSEQENFNEYNNFEHCDTEGDQHTQYALYMHPDDKEYLHTEIENEEKLMMNNNFKAAKNNKLGGVKKLTSGLMSTRSSASKSIIPVSPSKGSKLIAKEKEKEINSNSNINTINTSSSYSRNNSNSHYSQYKNPNKSNRTGNVVGNNQNLNSNLNNNSNNSTAKKTGLKSLTSNSNLMMKNRISVNTSSASSNFNPVQKKK